MERGESRQEKLTADTATVCRVVNLNHVHGTSCSSERDTESKQESSAHELALLVANALDNGADNDENGARQHTNSTTEAINGGADKRKGGNTTDLVHGGDDTSPDAVVFDMVLCLEPGVLQEIVDERTIVTVHGTAEEGNKGEEVDEELSLGVSIGRLLDHGLGKGLIASDDGSSKFALSYRKAALAKIFVFLVFFFFVFPLLAGDKVMVWIVALGGLPYMVRLIMNLSLVLFAHCDGCLQPFGHTSFFSGRLWLFLKSSTTTPMYEGLSNRDERDEGKEEEKD